MENSMKTLNNILLKNISATILGISSMVNAAELSTMTEIRTTVIEPTNIRAIYNPTNNLTVGHMLKGASFGNLMIEGYKVTTTFGDLKLNDNKGGSNLVLTDINNPLNTLEYTVVYSGSSGDIFPVINNTQSSHASELLPSNNMLMDVRLASTQNNVPAGQYSGMLNISISNQ